jgi:hypothetical protein
MSVMGCPSLAKGGPLTIPTYPPSVLATNEGPITIAVSITVGADGYGVEQAHAVALALVPLVVSVVLKRRRR